VQVTLTVAATSVEREATVDVALVERAEALLASGGTLRAEALAAAAGCEVPAARAALAVFAGRGRAFVDVDGTFRGRVLHPPIPPQAPRGS
jgi:hypothetical protein